MNSKKQASRRNFLKATGILTAGATLVGSLGVSRSAHAAGTDEIRLGMIGCGGRNNGAIRDRLQVGDNAKVVAVADAFEGSAKSAANGLRNDENFKGKVDLPDERVFHGLDSYKKVIDSLRPGIDQVVIATPPGFRPFHYKAAVEHGLHVFMEKPLFTDAGGFRSVMETNKLADEKKLKVCVGLQRRYEPNYYNWVKQIHDGKIGKLSYSRVYWNGGGIWCRQREAGESELHFQVRNWYHFVWLCGDNICEQHVHNLDIGNWIHSKGDPLTHPVEANAQGGRTFPAGPLELLQEAPPIADQGAWDNWYQKNKSKFPRHGQAWDHFFVEYTFADGTQMFSQCRHIANTWDNVSETAVGSAGTGRAGWLNDGENKTIWRNEEKVPKGSFQWEHDCHVKAIRENLDYPNNAYYGAMATMTAVMGREAAFSGKVVKWDDIVNKGVEHVPAGGIENFDQKAPVQPDANGFYEGSVAIPGRYNALKG